MNVFGIGPAEFIVIALIAVLVFGPDKVPEAARKAGKWYAEFRRMTQDITSQVTRQLDDEVREEERSKIVQEAGAVQPSIIDGESVPAPAPSTTPSPPEDAPVQRADP